MFILQNRISILNIFQIALNMANAAFTGLFNSPLIFFQSSGNYILLIFEYFEAGYGLMKQGMKQVFNQSLTFLRQPEDRFHSVLWKHGLWHFEMFFSMSHGSELFNSVLCVLRKPNSIQHIPNSLVLFYEKIEINVV